MTALGKAADNGAHPFVRSLAEAMREVVRQLVTLQETYDSLSSRMKSPEVMGDKTGDNR